MYRVEHCAAPKIMRELFNEDSFPYNISFRLYNVTTVLLRRCHTSNLNPGIWFVLILEIVSQNKFCANRLKNGNQIDVHVGSAKYTFLI